MSGDRLPKIKITVVRGLTAEEVLDGNVPEYFPENFESPCPVHTTGQEFILEGTKCPEGFCSWAWADIQKDIVGLYYGGPDWTGMHPNYVTCTDGMRPVVFKIEKTGEWA